MSKFDLAGINSLGGFEFEGLIGKLIETMGYTIEQTKKTGDGGIDIIAYTDKPIISGKYIIQCKRHNSPISEHIIRDLYGVMTSENANKGILVTNSDFTSNAISFAKGKPIELIDGTALANLLTKYLTDENVLAKRVFSIHQERIVNKVVDLLKKYEKTYYDLKNNLIYNPGKHIDTFPDFIAYTLKELEERQQLIIVMGNVVKYLDSVLRENADCIDNEKVTSSLNTFNDILDNLFKHFKNMHFLRVGQDFINLKEIELEFYAIYIESLINWKNSMLDVLTHPEKYSNEKAISINWTVDDNKLNMNVQEFNKELHRLKKIFNPPKKSCFIATACFGENAIEVETFTKFRDHFLIYTLWGRKLISIYYKIGPYMARLIQRNIYLKKIAYFLLYFLHNLIKK